MPMTSRIELRHLRYFAAVAEERSVTRAARRLHMEQPPLSQLVHALEAALGLPLLERLPRRVELTAGGEALFADAQAILAAVPAAAERARRVATGMEGALSLGLASSAATHAIVPSLIARFRERHPEVDLSFVEGNAATLTDAIAAASLDVALVRAPVDRPPEVRFDQLLLEPMLAVVAASDPLARQAARRKPAWIGLRELASRPFILVRRPGAPGMYGDLLAACEAAGITPQVGAEVGNMLTNILLVASAVGV